jgi:prepilin-type N-terminal cleavage/methylation domain-containing protein/prepilin-type processing-associated H-X9-DG protein
MRCFVLPISRAIQRLRFSAEQSDEKRSSFPARGFTLVELLVVIAIIGILMALIIPAVQSSRETGRKTQCANNLRQQGLAAQAFHVSKKHYPYSWGDADDWVNWGRSLLPYLEERALYDSWDRGQGYASAANAKCLATPLPLYKCPTSPSEPTYQFTFEGREQTYGTSDYKGCQSVNASDALLKHWGRTGWINGVVGRFPVKSAQIRDGESKTLLLVESSGGLVIYDASKQTWTAMPKIWFHTDGSWGGRALSGLSPTDQAVTLKTSVCTVNCSNMYSYGPYSFHPNGANVVLADGSTHFLVEEMDPATIGAMYSYNDGQSIGQF